MAKFTDILAALTASPDMRQPAEVTALDGVTPIKLAFVLLSPSDDADIEEGAVDFARAHKVADPKPGNGQYERGLMLHTLLRACVDPDVTDKREPYFSSLEQIASGRLLDDGRCALLFFAQKAFQRERSPNPHRGQQPEEYLALVYESVAAEARGDDPALPFVDLPRGTLVNFATQSVHLLSSPRLPPSAPGSERPNAAASSSSSAPT
jgi:hypothetical protein